MIEKQMERLKEKTGKSEALIYKEDNHYSLLFPNQTEHNGVLIELLESNDIVVWCYDIPNITNENTILSIISCFDCDIIIPFIDNNTELLFLLDHGFVKYDFHDELVDDSTKILPSVILKRKED